MDSFTIGNKSRVLHYKFFVTILVMASLNYGAQLYIDSKDWFLQGYGFIVWILPTISLAFSLLVIDNSRFIFSQAKEIIALEKVARYFLNKGKVNAAAKIVNTIRVAKGVCEKAGVNYGDLAFFLNLKDGINAGNLGGSGNGVVMLDLGSVTELNDEQLAGVIAHELGHAVNGDSALGSVMRSLMKTFTGWFWFMVFVIGYFEGLWWSCGFFVLVAFLLPMLKVSVGREMERASDMFAVALGYGEGLLSAFNKIAAQHKINSPLHDWVLHLGNDHPPLFSRVNDIKRMLNNDQGAVKDGAEATLWSLGKVAVLVGIGIYLATKEWAIPTILGVPQIYFLSAMWLYATESFLTLSNHKLKSSPKTETQILNVIIGLVFVTAVYIFGIYANKQVMSVITELGFLATLSFYLWIAKPITLLFGEKYISFSLINLFGTYSNIVFMALAISILVLK